MKKRNQLLKAARAAFGRDGYSRSSIDRIALDAAVSTRTIYNHFSSKEALFTAVIEESASLLAAQLTAAVESRLEGVTDLQDALTDLAKTWFYIRQENAAHLAMIQQAMAEARHLPAGLVNRWIEVGPARSTRVLADQLGRLMGGGYLRPSAPYRAANHFILLTIGELSRETFGASLAPSQAQIDAAVKDGVGAFLHGYSGARE